MNFYDAFKEDREIPLHEAAHFFVGIKKFAEWTDPPDMTGQLEGQFNVPVEQVLEKLKTVIAMKFRKMVGYFTYAQSFRDHAWRAIKDEFGEHAHDEHEDAEFYLKRAVALGGPVHMDDIAAPPPSNNPLGILKMMARAEQEAIAAQRELLALVGDENPMRVGIEEALGHDQHHLDEMWQLMTQEEHQAVELGDVGMPGEEELPPEEGVEPEFPQAGEDEPMEVMASMRLMSKLALIPELVGIHTGYSPGRNVAGEVAAAMSPEGRVVRSENLARQGATVGAPVGSLAAMYGAHKYDLSGRAAALGRALGLSPPTAEVVARTGVPIAAGLLGGLGGGALTGTGVGAVQTLRGSPKGHGKNTKKEREKTSAAEKTPPTDKELKETGRQRGVTALAAEARREKGRRGERFGQAIGTLGGAAGGAALGKRYIGGRAGTIAGMAAGALSGGKLGKEVGTEHDIHKNAFVNEKIASMRFELALMKLAEGEGDMEGMAAPTAGEMEPANYLQAEMLGRQAQEQNESAFYREQLGQAKQQAASMQQQVADAQMQLQQVQQQAEQAGAQIQAATQQAVAAQDAATQQTLEAAKARIGAQEMRAKLLDIVSQDPQQIGEQALAPAAPPGIEGMPPEVGAPGMEGEPGMEAAPEAGMVPPPGPEGPAGGAPTPPVPPGGVPVAGGGTEVMAGPPPGPGPEMAAPAGQLKTGSLRKFASPLSDRLLGAGIGAAMGAGSSLYAGSQAPEMAQKAQQMEAQRDGSFLQAVQAARAKHQAVAADLAARHPVGSAIVGGLGGAATGAFVAPGLRREGKRFAELAPEAAEAVKDVLTRSIGR